MLIPECVPLRAIFSSVVNEITTVIPSDSKFTVQIVKWRSSCRIFATIINRVCSNADLWINMPRRKVVIVKILYCEVLEFCGIKKVTEEPGRRTIANFIWVF
jgi:hypothetical protein